MRKKVENKLDGCSIDLSRGTYVTIREDGRKRVQQVRSGGDGSSLKLAEISLSCQTSLAAQFWTKRYGEHMHERAVRKAR